MQKLGTLFEAKQAVLLEVLEKAPGMGELVDIIQTTCSTLLDEYQEGLNKQQLGVAVSMFNAVHLSLEALSQTRIAKGISASQPVSSRSRYSKQGEIAVEAIGSAAVAAFVGGVFGTILGSLTGVLIGNGLSMAGQKQEPATAIPLAANSPQLVIDGEVVLENLSAIFRVIDNVVGQFSQAPAIPKPQLEDHPDILEYLQELVGDAEMAKSQLPKPIQSRIKQASGVLRKYGINLQYYQPKMNQEKAELWFDFEKSLDPNIKKAYTLFPAFVKGENVLLAGRVVVPTREAASKQ